MKPDDAKYLAELILADFYPIAPELTEDQVKQMQAVIVGWAQRITMAVK